MKKTPQYLVSALVILLFGLAPICSQAQNKHIGALIKAGKQDAETLTKAYLKPVPNGLGADLNTGWFNSAKTHKTLGFDIQIRGGLAFVPTSDQQFNLNNLNLKNVEPADPSKTISPTAAGASKQGPSIIVKDPKNGNQVAQFNLPQGSGYHFIPAPMLQATVGLIKHTDIILRYIPKVNYQDYGSVNMEGVGIKHNLNQWIPGGKLIPIDISVMAGYSHLNISGNLNVQPEAGSIPDPKHPQKYTNQVVNTNFDTFTARVIVGKSFLSVFDLFGSFDYETSKMKLAMKGDYPVPVSIAAGQTRTETLTNPFAYSQHGSNEYGFTGGLKINLLFFNIFGEYTLSKYPVANGGIGFSFR